MNLILAIISGLLTAVSFPTVFGSIALPNMGFLAWFSLVPLFYAIHNATPRRAFAMAFLTAFIYYSISLYWLYTAMTTYGHLGGLASISVLILMMMILSAYIGLSPMLGAWVEKKAGIDRFWTVPLFWVVFDFARNFMPCNGFPWGSLTNTQYAYLPVIQIVDITGIYGLLYVMVVVNLAIGMSLRALAKQSSANNSGDCHARLWRASATNPADKRNDSIFGQIIFAVTLAAITFFYGTLRIHDIDRKQEGWPSRRVALLQGNIPQEDKWKPGMEERSLVPYQISMDMLKSSKIDLAVWPESSYPWVIPADTAELPLEHFLGWTHEDAMKSGIEYTLLGGLTSEMDGHILYNSALLIGGMGEIFERYHKMHLVPFGEYVPYKKFLFFAKKLVAPVGNFAAGKEAIPFMVDGWRVGALVCYEDIFPEISREHTRNFANILAVITNDAWYGRSSAAFQHMAISVFRAVENRRWLVRAANSGISAVIDAKGQVISKTGIFEQGMIVSNVKIGSGETIYTKYGDWFAWGCVGIAAMMLLWAGKVGLRIKN